MIRFIRQTISFFAVFLTMNACYPDNNTHTDKAENHITKKITTHKNKYAQLFQISETTNGIFIEIFDKNKKLIDSLTVTNNTKNISARKSIAPNPKIVCLSTTHLALAEYAGAVNQIIGISNSAYIYNPEIRQRVADRKIRDIGYQGAINWELLISLQPDLVIVYNVDEAGAQTISQLQKFNIPYLFITEYQEPELLGQTEWALVFASLFDNLEETKNKLKQSFTSYERLKKQCDSISDKPVVMLNMPWNGAWYIPGGQSGIAKLIDDAGGKYVFASDSLMHNRPISVEDMIINAQNADFWLNPGQAKSINDILQTDSRLDLFSPIKSGKIFNRINRISPDGGNDFMESGVVNADLILRDLIKILHPERLTDSTEFYYYKKLSRTIQPQR